MVRKRKSVSEACLAKIKKKPSEVSRDWLLEEKKAEKTVFWMPPKHDTRFWCHDLIGNLTKNIYILN